MARRNLQTRRERWDRYCRRINSVVPYHEILCVSTMAAQPRENYEEKTGLAVFPIAPLAIINSFKPNTDEPHRSGSLRY